VDRIPALSEFRPAFRTFVENKIALHRDYIGEHGIDLPEILHWTWSSIPGRDELWTKASEFSDPFLKIMDYREV
jgi:hypothetical protein